MDAKEEAQKKITDSINILQEQRNSALDALVNTTVDLRITSTKLDQAQAKFKELLSNFDAVTTQNTELKTRLATQQVHIEAIEKNNADLLSSLDKLKAKTLPKVKKS